MTATTSASALDRQARIPATRRLLSSHGPAALLAMLVPAVCFPIGLVLLRDHPRFSWVRDIALCPWELAVVAVCGSVATLAGAIDWCIHRSGTTVVGIKEHRAHVLALAGGGIPLFILMAAASVLSHPAFIIPITVVLIFTVVLICYDEFVFHKRCRPFEVWMHRLLTFGNGLAFLAWLHWCFVRTHTA